MIKNSIFEDFSRNIPLKTRLEVAIRMYFLDKHRGYLLMPINEDGSDVEEAVKKNEEINKMSQPIIDLVLKIVDESKN